MSKKKPEEKTKVGRPSEYFKVDLEQLVKLCKLGATDKDLADFYDVCEATINNWKQEHPEFLESIKKGKIVADANVSERLYQRALGFEHDSEEIKVIYDPEEAKNVIERVPIKKIYPPDTTAAIFWLKNRQPDKWRDRVEQDITSKDEPIRTYNFIPASHGSRHPD